MKRKSNSKMRPLAVSNSSRESWLVNILGFYIHNPWIVFALERNSIPEVLGSDMVVFLSNIQQGLNITKKKLFLVKDLISGKFLTANVKKKTKLVKQ